jgi:hypothetical protein
MRPLDFSNSFQNSLERPQEGIHRSALFELNYLELFGIVEEGTHRSALTTLALPAHNFFSRNVSFLLSVCREIRTTEYCQPIFPFEAKNTLISSLLTAGLSFKL